MSCPLWRPRCTARGRPRPCTVQLTPLYAPTRPCAHRRRAACAPRLIAAFSGRRRWAGPRCGPRWRACAAGRSVSQCFDPGRGRRPGGRERPVRPPRPSLSPPLFRGFACCCFASALDASCHQQLTAAGAPADVPRPSPCSGPMQVKMQRLPNRQTNPLPRPGAAVPPRTCVCSQTHKIDCYRSQHPFCSCNPRTFAACLAAWGLEGAEV